MFGKREPGQLRERLYQIERDAKLGKLNKEASERQRREILSALKQLGEKLNHSELQLLENLSPESTVRHNYVQIDEKSPKGKIAVAIAAEEVRVNESTWKSHGKHVNG